MRGASRSSPFERILASRHAIWFFAGFYFCAYVPFTGLTKALAVGLYPPAPPGGPPAEGIPGASLLPLSNLASLAVVLTFLTATGWWKFATQRRLGRLSIPVPTRWTALSGLCSSIILTTATLAYTFSGVSIVFVMLLMRGGVLVLAPIVDAFTGRETRWFSWIGLGLSLAALIVAFAEDGGWALSAVAVVDIAVYLLAYFVRLRFMSRLAKSDDPAVTKRYFVEEQLTTVPTTLVLLIVLALIGRGELMQQVRAGFTTHLSSGLVGETLLIGVFSQLVGIFGTLIFLDRRENTFSVPVNRCSSVLSGVVASVALALLLDAPFPSAAQLAGAALVVGAILVLSLAPAREREAAPTPASRR
jgi:drug/metabolite transporter (DMT)-like permease